MNTTTPFTTEKVFDFKSESILNCVSDSILIHGFSLCDGHIKTGQFVFINDATVVLSGYSREELLESNPMSFFRTAPEGWYVQLLKDSLEGNNTPLRTTLLNKDSVEILVEIKICIHKEQDCFFSTSVIHLIFENEISRKKSITFSEIPFLPSDKMPSFDTLISGVAHEINNPNSLISLSTDLLKDIWDEVWTIINNQPQADIPITVLGQEKGALHKNVTNLLNNIQSGSDRINRIISAIRDFIRIDLNEKKTDCDLPSIINSAVLTSDGLTKKNIENFNLIIGNDIPRIKGFQLLILRAFVNIINNAYEARTEASTKTTISMSRSNETNSVIISIIDDGAGIEPKNISHIFDPFFTTKRSKGHLGLGLSMAFSIVHKHKGTIEINSRHGFGTTVTIKLPIDSSDYKSL